jgi:hypothetical protein
MAPVRLAAVALGLLLSALAGTASAARPLPRVTMITDSVGGVLYWATGARHELAKGLDLELKTKTCRRLVVRGCPAYGELPPSALGTIQALGPRLGRLVVIDVGYNDNPDDYANGLDAVMRALVAAKVERVVWVTLEQTEDPWVSIDADIRSAAARWPQLVVADWAPVAAAHPGWFVDRAHMNAVGGLGFARFLRPIVLRACGRPCLRDLR